MFNIETCTTANNDPESSGAIPECHSGSIDTHVNCTSSLGKTCMHVYILFGEVKSIRLLGNCTMFHVSDKQKAKTDRGVQISHPQVHIITELYNIVQTHIQLLCSMGIRRIRCALLKMFWENVVTIVFSLHTLMRLHL